jgi:hypothetical protein
MKSFKALFPSTFKTCSDFFVCFLEFCRGLSGGMVFGPDGVLKTMITT